jgi:hypothetical protein
MITFVRTIVALPGKIGDVVALAKETAAHVKRVTGTDVAVGMSFGGAFSEVAWISHADSLADMEAANDKMMADAELRAQFKKWENMIVPGASRDHIWRHV